MPLPWSSSELRGRVLARAWKTAEWVSDRQLNLHWISFKQSRLDDPGAYILTDDQNIVPLTDQEKEWNAEMIREAQEQPEQLHQLRRVGAGNGDVRVSLMSLICRTIGAR